MEKKYKIGTYRKYQVKTYDCIIQLKNLFWKGFFFFLEGEEGNRKYFVNINPSQLNIAKKRYPFMKLTEVTNE